MLVGSNTGVLESALLFILYLLYLFSSVRPFCLPFPSFLSIYFSFPIFLPHFVAFFLYLFLLYRKHNSNYRYLIHKIRSSSCLRFPVFGLLAGRHNRFYTTNAIYALRYFFGWQPCNFYSYNVYVHRFSLPTTV